MKKHTPESLAKRIIRSFVDWSSVNLTLETFLAGRFPYRTLEEWRVCINRGELKINGETASPDQRLVLHDTIEYIPGELPEPPADLGYRIVFEDEKLLVIDKPGNLCMHPAGPFFRNTLWHLLCSRYGEIHFLNRLDRETSGLLLAAKDSGTAAKLSRSRQFSAKEYRVMVKGIFPEAVTAEGFLIADTSSAVRKKRRFVKELPEGAVKAETALTVLTPLEENGTYTMIKAELGTGRMHQIRATLLSLGYPVVGDKLYGEDETLYLRQRTDELTESDRKALLLPRQALHACRLSFLHPAEGKELEFFSTPPFSLADLQTSGQVSGAQ